MQYRALLILYCLLHFQGERSIFGVYHLLKGKRSSQTIQDGKLFKLSHLFQAMPDLKRVDVVETVEQLHRTGYLFEKKEGTFIPSTKGKQQIAIRLSKRPLPQYFHGWNYGQAADILWKRLSLTIQTLSNIKEENKRFYPINRDIHIQKWVRNNILVHRKDTEAFIESIYNECTSLLDQVSTLEADIFTLRLSGSHRFGYTFDQLASKFRADEDEVYLLFQNVLHFFISELEQQNNHYKLLSVFIDDVKEQVPLTVSTKKTYYLLKQQLAVDEISRIRRLKHSTIEDHIVEIALHDPTFNIEAFVPNEIQSQIKDAAETLGVRRMKPIMDSLDKSITYFQIRLVLARAGDPIES
jgi:uncharacterized protein YpbB